MAKLSSFVKNLVAYNISDDGIHFCGILTTGDLILWNKDTDQLRNITGRTEFALKLGFNCPSVFISNDTNKIVLITSRSKVYVWETDWLIQDTLLGKPFKASCCNNVGKTEGNWSAIVASKDIKTVEDSKELVSDVRFKVNLVSALLIDLSLIV